MKKIRILSAAIFCAAVILGGCGDSAPEYQIPDSPDVRNVVWNMTMDEVIFCEGKEPDQRYDNYIIYRNCRMEKIPMVDIEFKFYGNDIPNGKNNLLSSVVYIFTGTRKLENRQFHNNYITVAEEYTKKYGTPVSDERVTANEGNQGKLDAQNHENDFDFGGTAYYITEWETETTVIRLKLSYDSRESLMEVRYEYKETNNDL